MEYNSDQQVVQQYDRLKYLTKSPTNSYVIHVKQFIISRPTRSIGLRRCPKLLLQLFFHSKFFFSVNLCLLFFSSLGQETLFLPSNFFPALIFVAVKFTFTFKKCLFKKFISAEIFINHSFTMHCSLHSTSTLF